jgi:hypothetical protein
MGEKFSQLNDWERTRIMVMKAEARSVRATARSDYDIVGNCGS